MNFLYITVICAMLFWPCGTVPLERTDSDDATLLAVKLCNEANGYSDPDGSIVAAVKSLKICLIGLRMDQIDGGRFIPEGCHPQDGYNNSVSFDEDSLEYVSEHEVNIHGTILKRLEQGCNHYSICLHRSNTSSLQCYNNSKLWIKVEQTVRGYLVPLPFQITVIVVLSCFSGLFSGLNLGLMALTPEELEIVQKAAKEPHYERYATIILPVRRQGNYLLCSLLLGNVVCNTAISILFGDITDSLVAILASTMIIVIFGEILPQSICQRYNLAVGARTIYVTMFLMVITFPLAWPISKFLDFILRHEVPRSYNRERLCELIKTEVLHQMEDEKGACLNKCPDQEFQLLQGAIVYSCKPVKSIMTNISDVFMLESSELLTKKKMREISLAGYTRIPVYSQNKDNIIHILNVKDLTLLDFNDKITVGKIAKIWSRPVKFVDEDTELKSILNDFQAGTSHMFIVKCDAGSVTGVVTLEDVIEEILGAEIIDETDTITDNKAKIRIDQEDQRRATRRMIHHIFQSMDQLADPLYARLCSISSVVSDLPSMRDLPSISEYDDDVFTARPRKPTVDF